MEHEGIEDHPDVRGGNLEIVSRVARPANLPVHDAVAFGVNGSLRDGLWKPVYQ
jgi:hypothetical protein